MFTLVYSHPDLRLECGWFSDSFLFSERLGFQTPWIPECKCWPIAQGHGSYLLCLLTSWPWVLGHSQFIILARHISRQGLLGFSCFVSAVTISRLIFVKISLDWQWKWSLLFFNVWEKLCSLWTNDWLMHKWMNVWHYEISGSELWGDRENIQSTPRHQTLKKLEKLNVVVICFIPSFWFLGVHRNEIGFPSTKCYF